MQPPRERRPIDKGLPSLRSVRVLAPLRHEGVDYPPSEEPISISLDERSFTDLLAIQAISEVVPLTEAELAQARRSVDPWAATPAYQREERGDGKEGAPVKHNAYAPRLRVSQWDMDPELATFVRERLGKVPQTKILEEVEAEFGKERTPTRSALSRFAVVSGPAKK